MIRARDEVRAEGQGEGQSYEVREREREREIFIYITLCHSEADVRDWRRSAYTRLN